jgi:transposase
MARPHPFYRRSRISAKKFRQLLRLFALDLTATDVAHLTGLTRKSVTTIFLRIRGRLAEECERRSPLSAGRVEVDESYFGARRVRGKRGRGASGKTIVFGLLKREGKVYTEIVPDCKKATLRAIIRGRGALEAVIHSDGWRGYDGLVEVGYSKHFRVNHGKDEFVRGTHHVNGIESFWSYAKSRLHQFHGIAPEKFYLHLKECEYRFNQRRHNLYAELLKLLRKHPL